MSTDLQIQIASVPDREELVAEVWSGREQVAELRRTADGVRVQLYAPRDQRWWDFAYPDLVETLHRAHQELSK